MPHPWLAATAVGLPATVESAEAINAALRRPSGWLQKHAGIEQRRVWAGEDPLATEARTGRLCLGQAGLALTDLGLLLVTSEAPPLLAGLAAAIHFRMGLPASVPALEIGGACTGFLAALWAGQQILPFVRTVLVLSVEAHSLHLALGPGPAGEAAALFGDGTAACLLCATGDVLGSVPLVEVCLETDGATAGVLQVRPAASGGAEIDMKGPALAARAVRTMARGVRELCARHGLGVGQLAALVVHGGNGRLPGLLARQLGLDPERVWSESGLTGNLGSASLPVAWAARPLPAGPVVWSAVGAGLQSGTALLAPKE